MLECYIVGSSASVFHLRIVGQMKGAMPPVSSRQRSPSAIDALRIAKRVKRVNLSKNDRFKRIQERRLRKKQNQISSCVTNSSSVVSETIDSFLGTQHSVYDGIYSKCVDHLSTSCMSEKICCICDALHPAPNIVKKKVSKCPALISQMLSRLKSPADLPAELKNYYDCSDFYEAFDGLLMSRRGLCVQNGEVIMQMCNSCCVSLSKKNGNSPPKFAVANGLYIGSLPDKFDDSTMTENAMVNLSQSTRFLSVYRGGKHTSLRSHAYFFRSDPAPPVKLLPRSVVGTGEIAVKIVGAMTPEQKIAATRKYQVRSDRIRNLLDWYYENNYLYNQLDEITGWEISTVPTRVVEDETSIPESSESTVHANALDENTWRFNASTPSHATVSDEDELRVAVATALVTDFVGEDHISAAQTILQSKDVVVYRSTSILSDFDPSFWIFSFCELFPFGRGGLNEPRKVAIGLEEFLRYCLRLSSRRHEKHPSFTLVAFDVLARQRAMKAVYIRTKVMPSRVASAGKVSRDALVARVNYHEERLQSFQHNLPAPTPPPYDPHVRDLESGISTGMRAFWGSNQERVSARADLFSMQLNFGQPSIFFTISPSTSSSFRIANLAGEIDDASLDALQQCLDSSLQFSKAKLGEIATANPFVCAKYFDQLMCILISDVFDWDCEKGSSGTKGGIFGHTKAFFAATESQSSTGSLHAHILIWIDGLPTTARAYYELLKNEHLKNQMLRYVDAIATTNVPGSSSTCPRCELSNLTGLPFTQQAFRKPKRQALRPSTSICTGCESTFGSSEVIDESLKLVESRHQDSFAKLHDNFVFQRIAAPLPFPRTGGQMYSAAISRDALITAKALLSYQHHLWSHTKGCFKVTKRTPDGSTCRMFFPKEACPQTHWTEEDRIELKRDPGNEYINAYVPLINDIFKTNHDIKVLAAGEGPEKAYYTIKYTAKPQLNLENPLALHLTAFGKAKDRLANTLDDPVAAGRRCIQSMCCTLSNPHEVSAPLAGLYILRGSPFYSSHGFFKLYLRSVMDAVFDDAAVSAILEPNSTGSAFCARSIYFDYIHRPHELNTTNLLDFAANWPTQRNRRGLHFCKEHLQNTSHSLHRREKRLVVTVINERLPDTRQTLSPEKQLIFQRTISLLFRPFRSGDDFGSRAGTFEANFESWWKSQDSSAAHIYTDYNNDYYLSRELAQDNQDEDMTRYENYSSSGIQNDDNNCGNILSANELESSDDDDDDFADADEFVMRYESIQHISLLEKCNETVSLAAASIYVGDDQPIHQIPIDDIDAIIATAEKQNLYNAIDDSTDLLSPFNSLETRVQLFESAIGNVEWTDPSTITEAGPTQLLPFPSLQDVSRSFQLNKKQHKALVRFGRKILEGFIENSSDQQLIGFFGGLPGAGKSQVIKALQKLAEGWGCPDAVGTVAYQGVAAQAAGGQTIHKLFGWGVTCDQTKWTPSVDQIEKIYRMKLLIVDEISTCDVHILGRIDTSLRLILKQPRLRFGGLHVLLVGDWLQQLPVAGQPAYFIVPQYSMSSTATEAKDAAVYLDRIRGSDAYQHVNEVVMLDENMRHRSDPKWRDILQRWRKGVYLQSDVDYVNDLCYKKNWMSDEVLTTAFCPIIVTSNALRAEFNKTALRQFCAHNNRPMHKFPAEVKRTRFPLTSAQRRAMNTLRDDKTGGMPVDLSFSVGSPVQCTKNASSALKLANGSIGYVVDFVADDRDTFQVVDAGGVQIHIHSHPPLLVYVKLIGYEDSQLLSQFPCGVVPVRHRVERNVKITMPQRSFTVTVKQVPLVPAFALTSEKCQGLTVIKMILGPLRHSTRHSPQRSSFYVAVTRVKTLCQLYLMEPLSLSFLKYFTPRQDALQENSRLEALEAGSDY